MSCVNYCNLALDALFFLSLAESTPRNLQIIACNDLIKRNTVYLTRSPPALKARSLSRQL